MKIRPTPKSRGILLELGPDESQIPAQAVLAAPVFKLQKILVPVDFSDCSKKALQYAIPFARQFGAEVKLLYVIEPYPAAPEMALCDTESVEDAHRELDTLRKTISGAVRSSASVRKGAPHIEIAEAARESGADLVIISTHGRKGLPRMFLGSTTEKVVRHAPCPVLIVRESEKEFLSDSQIPANSK
jgi:universal stress protein A